MVARSQTLSSLGMRLRISISTCMVIVGGSEGSGIYRVQKYSPWTEKFSEYENRPKLSEYLHIEMFTEYENKDDHILWSFTMDAWTHVMRSYCPVTNISWTREGTGR